MKIKIISMVILLTYLGMSNTFGAEPNQEQMEEYIEAVNEYVTNKTDEVDTLISYIQGKTKLSDFDLAELEEHADQYSLNFSP